MVKHDKFNKIQRIYVYLIALTHPNVRQNNKIVIGKSEFIDKSNMALVTIFYFALFGTFVCILKKKTKVSNSLVYFQVHIGEK